MSFYTGRHRVGSVYKRQLHITAHQQALPYMQGGVQSDTVFHTDVQYVRVTPAKLTRHSYVYVVYNYYFISGKLWQTIYHRRARYRLPSNVLSLIRAGYAFFVTSGDYTKGANLKSNINSDTTLMTKHVHATGGRVSYKPESISWDGGCDGYCYESGGYLYVHTDSHNVLTVTVLDIKYNGYKLPMNPSPTNDIFIDNKTFNVNGIDVAKLKYLSISNKNSQDSVVNTGSLFRGGSFQLVNTKPPRPGIKFSCNPSSGTQVYVGDNIIIDSRLGSNGFKMYRHGQKTRAAHYNRGEEIVDKFGPVAEPGETIFFNVEMVGLGSATLIYGRGATNSQDPRITISFLTGVSRQNGYDVRWWIESGILTDGGRGTFYISSNPAAPHRNMPEVRISYVTIK